MTSNGIILMFVFVFLSCVSGEPFQATIYYIDRTDGNCNVMPVEFCTGLKNCYNKTCNLGHEFRNRDIYTLIDPVVNTCPRKLTENIELALDWGLELELQFQYGLGATIVAFDNYCRFLKWFPCASARTCFEIICRYYKEFGMAYVGLRFNGVDACPIA